MWPESKESWCVNPAPGPGCASKDKQALGPIWLETGYTLSLRSFSSTLRTSWIVVRMTGSSIGCRTKGLHLIKTPDSAPGTREETPLHSHFTKEKVQCKDVNSSMSCHNLLLPSQVGPQGTPCPSSFNTMWVQSLSPLSSKGPLIFLKYVLFIYLFLPIDVWCFFFFLQIFI